jgi:NAD(P)-dependent dehydrogenase (short-subunit alcohol dehydrogenase family)
MRFRNKVVIIIGAGSGIGRQASEVFSREGARVVRVDINKDALSKLDGESSSNHNELTVIADVMDENQVKGVMAKTLEAFGVIDILVNAVGGSTVIKNSFAETDDLSVDDWDQMMRFNLRGVFLCTREAIIHMKKQKNGKIVNLASVAGRGVSEFSSSAYAAAKAGVIIFTKKVAIEVGPYGITCNAVAPGLTLTDRMQRRWEVATEDQKEHLLNSIPLGRLSSVEDQANAIAFLASDDANYITGITIDVNGGKF